MWGEFWSSRMSWGAFSFYSKLLATQRVPWKVRGHNVAALVRQAPLIKWKKKNKQTNVQTNKKKSSREFTLGRHYFCFKIRKWYTRTRKVVRGGGGEGGGEGGWGRWLYCFPPTYLGPLRLPVWRQIVTGKILGSLVQLSKGYLSYLDKRGRGKAKKLANIAIYR